MNVTSLLSTRLSQPTPRPAVEGQTQSKWLDAAPASGVAAPSRLTRGERETSEIVPTFSLPQLALQHATQAGQPTDAAEGYAELSTTLQAAGAPAETIDRVNALAVSIAQLPESTDRFLLTMLTQRAQKLNDIATALADPRTPEAARPAIEERFETLLEFGEDIVSGILSPGAPPTQTPSTDLSQLQPPEFDEAPFVGRHADEVIRELAPDRVLGPNSAMTLDLNTGRLNVMVDANGKVTRVAYF